MIREDWFLSEEYKETCIMILQDNLSALRAKAGLTQEELSGFVGISRQTYNAIETQKKIMTWNNYFVLSLFYHELQSTRDMLNEIRGYPLELILKLNGKIDIQLR